MAAKKQESLIHLRFNPQEAISGKKDILLAEISMLKISQHIKSYQKLRMQELKNKEQIQAKIKATKKELAKLHRLLPKVKIPKILEKEEDKTIKKSKKEEEEHPIKRYGTIEDQLKEIQAKLKALE